jgi:cob(I)alamin adenosyltransferase
MLKQGLIQIYTARSKHFNFAPIGLSLRAIGQGFRVLITCFEPHEKMDSAAMLSLILKPQLVIDHSAVEGLTDHETGAPRRLRDSFERAREAACSGDYDIVILNGILPIVKKGIISEQMILKLLRDKNPHVELVLTGRDATEGLIDEAHLVTEMVVYEGSEKGSPGEEAGGPAPIEVITGDGKGKTTYCLGKALFMSAMGIRSTVLQFMKSPQAYGEVKAIDRVPRLEIRTMGEGFLYTNSPAELRKHRQAARGAWEKCLREIFSLKYGLVALDEINTATYYGLVHGERVREMLFLKPHDLYLLLSGRNAHLEVIEAASVVIHMKEVKHPFAKGIMARRGIEF